MACNARLLARLAMPVAFHSKQSWHGWPFRCDHGLAHRRQPGDCRWSKLIAKRPRLAQPRPAKTHATKFHRQK